jgi:hypothetical protein
VDDASSALASWDGLRGGQSREEVGGLLGVSDAQQHYLAGSTYLWLRDPEEADKEIGQALSLFDRTPADQRFYGAENLARIDASRAVLDGEGDLERAEAHLDLVLAVEPDQRLETFIQSLGHVRSRLACPQYRGNRKAQELQERLEVYAQEAVSRTLDLRG